MIWGDDYSVAEHTAPLMTARRVLDLHADLHRYLTTMGPAERDKFAEYGIQDLLFSGGIRHEWAATHLHPATDMRDLAPWLDSLGKDLAHATTYQVTAEMISLAESLTATTPKLDDIVAEDLPSDSGFMWLDRPVERPSEEDKPGQQPLVMHAVSWVKVPQLRVQIGPGGPKAWVPAVRIREWGWCDLPGIAPRPIHMMGQSTVPLTPKIHNPLRELHLVHMIWILMGMEIVSSAPHHTNRAGARRAEKIGQDRVRVVTLRRTRHGEGEGQRRRVDWTCTWLVRGHYRSAPHGGTYADGRDRTWIKPHIKGPDGLPLRASDLIYKLAR